jgi:hypothetical protein
VIVLAFTGGGARAGDSSKAKLRMVGPAGHVTEVHLVAGKDDATLETFPTPQQIVGSGISADGRWAFVWHVTRPPQVLSVYDLASHQRTTSFEPGFGGDVRWTRADTLLHSWGCGTDCQMFRLYDTKGAVLFEGSAGMHTESPSMRFMLTGPATAASTEDIKLVDLEAAQVLSVTKDPAPGMAIVAQRWDEAHHQVEVKLGAAGAAAKKTVMIPLPD